jgi:hypothetical protein
VKYVLEQDFSGLFDVYNKCGTKRHDALLPCLMRREHGALGWCRVSGRAHQWCTIPDAGGPLMVKIAQWH